MLPQQLHDGGRGRDGAGLVVLQGDKPVLATGLLLPLKLLLYQDRTGGEVYTGTRQAQHFALTHTGEQRHRIQRFELVPLDSVRKGPRFPLV